MPNPKNVKSPKTESRLITSPVSIKTRHSNAQLRRDCAKQRQALQMSMVDLEGKEGYRPSTEYVEDSNETLINLTDSTELLFLKLPSSNDFLSDIHGQKLFLTLHNDGKLASFKDSSGKVYDFVSYSAQEPDETVFVSSTEPKIGKISRRVSTVHYSDPKELEKLNSTNAKHAHGNSSGVTGTTSSRYFPMQSSGAASSKGSRQRSSLTEASEPSSISKRRHASKSKSNLSEASHGHSTGISSMSPDHSHEGKAKRRKHKE
ncbi:Mediator-associated protein 2 [Glycine soja]